MTRTLLAASWLLVIGGVALATVGGALSWVGLAAWLTGLGLQVVGIARTRARGAGNPPASPY